MISLPPSDFKPKYFIEQKALSYYFIRPKYIDWSRYREGVEEIASIVSGDSSISLALDS
jgi:hypothetical protein